MNAPLNDPYRRRFTNPAGRPSNHPFADVAVAETARTIRRLNAWLDDFDALKTAGPAVVAAAIHTCREAAR